MNGLKRLLTIAGAMLALSQAPAVHAEGLGQQDLDEALRAR